MLSEPQPQLDPGAGSLTCHMISLSWRPYTVDMTEHNRNCRHIHIFCAPEKHEISLLNFTNVKMFQIWSFILDEQTLRDYFRLFLTQKSLQCILG